MSKALTLELIHMKTKTNRIDGIKNLNLWGNDLDDISIVNQMPALEVLSLSVNNISTLRDV
jgi:Leucine-rich repeat (LRR) protein